jgi:hypothetical protein
VLLECRQVYQAQAALGGWVCRDVTGRRLCPPRVPQPARSSAPARPRTVPGGGGAAGGRGRRCHVQARTDAGDRYDDRNREMTQRLGTGAFA